MDDFNYLISKGHVGIIKKGDIQELAMNIQGIEAELYEVKGMILLDDAITTAIANSDELKLIRNYENPNIPAYERRQRMVSTNLIREVAEKHGMYIWKNNLELQKNTCNRFPRWTKDQLNRYHASSVDALTLINERIRHSATYKPK